MKYLSVLLPGIFTVVLAGALQADEQGARAKIEEYEGQILGVAQNVDGVRILIPPKTFEGRILKDEDLSVLPEIPKIIELDIKGSAIGDEGVKYLKEIPSLERLHLEKTKVTDAGLAYLAGLANLKYLNLYGTAVTDAGLKHLKGLKKLHNLYLWQTKVSEEAAKAYHAAMEAAGNDQLEINLGWEKEILSKVRLARLQQQKAALEARKSGKPKKAVKLVVVEDPDFATHILPIFKNSCIKCHGEEKHKGKLRLDSFELVMKGADGDAVIVQGKPGESELCKRIFLPADDDDAMPAEGDRLSKEAKQLIVNWIKQGAKPKAEVKPIEVASAEVENPDFATHILPIFKETCVKCHGEKKQKGKLRLDSFAALIKGSEDGPVVEPGDLIGSELFQRITLPADDDDIMPAKGGPLAKDKIRLIKNWIANGAKEKVIAKVAKAVAAKPKKKGKPAAAVSEEGSVFAEYVKPIFQDRCFKCHGEKKQKGKLRLDSLAALLKGSEDGPVVVAGKPGESELFKRITLPPGDDDIMPSKGDPLTKAQISLIKLWIAGGAR